MALLPVDEALRRILDGVKPLPAETVTLGGGLNRVLAHPLKAKRDQPPFDASAMDGYAVRAADVANAPAVLTRIGMSAAGHGFRGRVRPGTACRIFTGAPMPAGADTVVIQENTVSGSEAVEIVRAPLPGANVRMQGLDFRRGETLLRPGTALSARDLGLAAAMNCDAIRVRRKPRIAILATGDELVRPGIPPKPDQIVSSNTTALAALVHTFGGEPVDLGIARDSLAATTRAVKKATGADILLTTGGASVGEHDYVNDALRAAGVKVGFWKIAMRPGKPFMYGRKGRLHVMGLPGNPVSALVCARLFLKPLIDALLGRQPKPDIVPAMLNAALRANDDRQDHIRATLAADDRGQRVATPFARQDSSMLRTFREADCLIVRPAHAPAAEKGDFVPVILLDF